MEKKVYTQNNLEWKRGIRVKKKITHLKRVLTGTTTTTTLNGRIRVGKQKLYVLAAAAIMIRVWH